MAKFTPRGSTDKQNRAYTSLEKIAIANLVMNIVNTSIILITFYLLYTKG